ncbi:hypothetical protein [Dactylosporangium sp. NPDC051541]|uniref:hypothetical protein n=1 Tax=Dactylosporangium sp. NPDC051541 TaxID=3363977 RepID=UPI0037A1314B
MKTTRSKRLGLALAAVLGAVGVSMLIPAIGQTAVPAPLPAGITMGTLHLFPNHGDGSESPSFTAETACAPGTTLANVNTIDEAGTEQTISLNVPGAVAVSPNFGAGFQTTMDTIPVLAGNGTGGVDDSFLFVVDCRTGAGTGTFTDALIVDFKADGTWQVRGETPTSPSPSASASASPSASRSPSASASPSTSASASASASPSPSASASESASPTPSVSISTTPAANTGQLPVTGTDVVSLVGVSAGLIALGVTMRYGARRRS